MMSFGCAGPAKAAQARPHPFHAQTADYKHREAGVVKRNEEIYADIFLILFWWISRGLNAMWHQALPALSVTVGC